VEPAAAAGMDDDLYFSRTSRPQDTARGSGMVFYDDQVGCDADTTHVKGLLCAREIFDAWVRSLRFGGVVVVRRLRGRSAPRASRRRRLESPTR